MGTCSAGVYRNTVTTPMHDPTPREKALEECGSVITDLAKHIRELQRAEYRTVLTLDGAECERILLADPNHPRHRKPIRDPHDPDTASFYWDSNSVLRVVHRGSGCGLNPPVPSELIEELLPYLVADASPETRRVLLEQLAKEATSKPVTVKPIPGIDDLRDVGWGSA